MIGRIIFESGGEEIEAVLGDDGRWTCPDPFFARALNHACSTADHSPADGVFGYRQLRDAAERYGGRVEITTPKHRDSGRIY